MKRLKLVPIFLIAFLFSVYSAEAQIEEEEVIIEEVEDEVSSITGVFKGIEEGTYLFSFIDEDGEESTINFDKIAPEAAQLFDLRKKEMIGKTFVVSYVNINEEEEDEDGEIEYISVKTILSLEKL